MIKFLKFLYILKKVLIFTVTSLFISLGLFFIVLQLLIIYADDFKDEISSVASSMLNQAVSIGHIQTERKGFKFRIEINRLSVKDNAKKHQHFEAKNTYIRFDLSALFYPQKPVHGYFQFEGIDIETTKSPTQLADADVEPLLLKNNSMIWWLTHKSNIHLSKISIKVFDQNNQLQDHFTDIQASLTHSTNKHQLLINVKLAKDWGNDLLILADLDGDFTNISQWKGMLYVKWRDIKLDQYKLLKTLKTSTKIKQNTGDIEVWLSIGKSGNTRKNANSLYSKVRFTSHQNKKKHEVIKFDGDVLWRYVDKKWIWDVSDLSINIADIHNQIDLIHILFDETKKNKPLKIILSSVPLSQIKSLVKLNPTKTELQTTINKINLTGSLENVQINYGNGQWLIKGKMNNISSRPYQAIPGIKNFSGYFKGNHQNGSFWFNHQKFSIKAKSLYNNTLFVNDLSGMISWHKAQNNWIIKSKRLQIKTPEITLNNYFKIKLNHVLENTVVELKSQVSEGKLGQLKHLFPQKVMSKGLIKWVDMALVEGKYKGIIQIQGKLKDFPFKNNKGFMNINLDVKNAIVRYAKDWPEINSLDAFFSIHNQQLKTTSQHGKISGAHLKKITVDIANFIDANKIHIDGDADTTIKNGLHFLSDSPLKKDTEALTNSIKGLKGNIKVLVNLVVPLDDSEFIVSARTKLMNNTINISDTEFNISGINGDIIYNEYGLFGKKIKAKMLGQKAIINIETIKKDKLSNLNIAIDSIFNLQRSNLKSSLKKSLNAYFSGTTKWHSDINVPLKQPNKFVKIAINSSLEGLAVNIPPPLTKNKKQTTLLKVLAKPDKKNDWHVALDYGDHLKSRFLFSKIAAHLKLTKGGIFLGQRKPEVLRKSGTHIFTKLNTLDAIPWLEFIDQIGSEDIGETNNPMLDSFHLDVKQYQLPGFNIDNMRMLGQHQNNRWNIDIKSDQVKGKIVFEPNKPLKISLKQLNIKKDKTDKTESETQQSQHSQPTDIPTIELTADSLIYNGHQLGKLKLNGINKGQSYQFENIQLSSQNYQLQAKAGWTYNDKQPYSEISGEFKANDPGELLKKLGYGSTMSGGKSKIIFNINWPVLTDPDPEKLNGRVQLDVTKGIFKEIEPGVGRVFGLLSFESLKRRLILDFSDLFKSGFGFDQIKGGFTINNGVATTDDLFMDAPAARIDVSGSSLLTAQVYDQTVMVTPKLSSTLPLTGALIAGPTGAISMLLFQKIFGKQIDKITQDEYTVKGSWENPSITKLKRSNKSVNKLLKRMGLEEGINDDDEFMNEMEGNN